MFRRFFIIAIALLLVGAPALAAGTLEVIQETMNTYDSYGTVYADVFAEVENTGDRPVEFSAGLLELVDTSGNTVDSTDFIYCYPTVLAPGEKGFIIVNMYPENASSPSDIADYILTVTGKDSTGTTALLKSTGTYDADVTEGYWTYDYLTAEITNDTDAPVYDFYTAYAVKDAQGVLLYATYSSTYMVGIPAGGTVLMRYTMPDGTVTLFEDNGLVPATVETISYVNSY